MDVINMTRVNSSVRRRSRMSAGRRRQHLIDAAQQLFSSGGFRGTSTRAIAEAAGVSEALLFRHFPTKADLYKAILLEKADATGLSERMEELRHLTQGDDDEALVRFFVRGTLINNEQDLPFARLMMYAALEGHELAATSHQIFGIPISAALEEYILRRQEAGVFRKGDPRLIAVGIAALPAYFSQVYRVLRIRHDSFALQEVIDLFTSMILDSVRVPPHAHVQKRRRPDRGEPRRAK